MENFAHYIVILLAGVVLGFVIYKFITNQTIVGDTTGTNTQVGGGVVRDEDKDKTDDDATKLLDDNGKGKL